MTIIAKNGRLPIGPSFAEGTRNLKEALQTATETWPRSLAAGVPAGYTYLGQFIAHDIAPRPGVNSRSWRLDLDSVYGLGSGQTNRPAADCHYDPSTGKLFPQTDADKLYDLPRKADHVAYIPEFRNEDQVLIAQFHLLMIRLHNRLIREIFASTGEPNIEQAIKGARATLQRIAIHDYAMRFALPEVFAAVFQHGRKFIEVPTKEAQLPVQLTHAAFRFGHSQVRQKYQINSQVSADLPTLFEQTGSRNGHGAGFTGLPRYLAVDWRLFFSDFSHITPQEAQSIDLSIASALRGPHADIVNKNLDAAIREKLESGQTVARALQDEANDLGVTPDIIFSPVRNEEQNLLVELGLNGELPLWSFLLLESSEHSVARGAKLGPLGSLLLCETIRNVVDSINLEEAQADALPGLEQVDSMSALLRFAGPSPFLGPDLTLH